ncbi:MAG: hypothetical protein M1816_006259 [Peltula sp. TS41687]|nr:MAG: hypothetical protein M1816_006259 [Peltula sp. TS41687]
MPVRLHLNPPRGLPPATAIPSSPPVQAQAQVQEHDHDHDQPQQQPQSPETPRTSTKTTKSRRFFTRRERVDIPFPQLDINQVQPIIYMVETSIDNLLLSAAAAAAAANNKNDNGYVVVARDLSRQPRFASLQIFEPLLGLAARFRAHYSAIQTYAERTEVFEKYHIRCGKWISTIQPSPHEVGLRLRRLLRRLPCVDNAYVMSFAGFNLHLMAATELLTGLAAFLSSVLQPTPAAAEDLIIEPAAHAPEPEPDSPDETDPWPVARQLRQTLPEGTARWQVQLFRRYGAGALVGPQQVSIEVEDVVIKALRGVQEVLRFVQRCAEMCEAQATRAVAMKEVWEDWRDTVLEWEELEGVGSEMEGEEEEEEEEEEEREKGY